jgi:hypothetical protein
MKRATLIVAAIIAAACSTPSSVSPISVPLQYKMMVSPAEFPTLPPCAAVSRVEVVDTRAEKTIGKRFVEAKNSPSAAVTTSTDVGAWAKAGVENALTRAGAATNAEAPILHIGIEQIATGENVLHRAGYEGRIVLTAELRPARSGSACWKDRADGFSENYGYAGSVENYQETLNHALDRAIVRILGAPEFKKSVCSCGGA